MAAFFLLILVVLGPLADRHGVDSRGLNDGHRFGD